MKLVFVYWGYENAGSMLDLRGYTRAAQAMGHEVTVYGPANPVFALNYSQDLAGADAVIFVVEWTTELQYGDRLDWARLVTSVPRRRRVVIDCDGAYNEPILFHGDYNHRTEEASRKWREVCDSLSDKICQPTLRPRLPNVRPFLFHIYDPTWEAPLDFAGKEFSMIYVGHTKFRWRGMSRVLQAIEPVREQVGRVALVGEGWDNPPEWTQWLEVRNDYYVDRDYLQRLEHRDHAADSLSAGSGDHEQGGLQPGHVPPAVRIPGDGHLPYLRDAGGRDHSAVRSGAGVCAGDLR